MAIAVQTPPQLEGPFGEGFGQIRVSELALQLRERVQRRGEGRVVRPERLLLKCQRTLQRRQGLGVLSQHVLCVTEIVQCREVEAVPLAQ